MSCRAAVELGLASAVMGQRLERARDLHHISD